MLRQDIYWSKGKFIESVCYIIQLLFFSPLCYPPYMTLFLVYVYVSNYFSLYYGNSYCFSNVMGSMFNIY